MSRVYQGGALPLGLLLEIVVLKSMVKLTVVIFLPSRRSFPEGHPRVADGFTRSDPYETPASCKSERVARYTRARYRSSGQ
jgi:hypothetical protein